MIFITLGSQKFQFDRLLRAVDKLQINEEIFAQIGYSQYKPKNFKYKEFLDRDEFSKIMDNASVVITHGGTGAIVGALKKGKKVIAVPRLAKYAEHVDDHQLQLIREFNNLGLIYACEDLDIEKALTVVKKSTYRKYESNTQAIIKNLEDFIEEVR